MECLPNLAMAEIRNLLDDHTSVGARELKLSILCLKMGFWWAEPMGGRVMRAPPSAHSIPPMT